MVLLGLLNAFAAVMNGLFSVISFAGITLPHAVSTMIAYINDMILSGYHILFYCFLDVDYLRSVSAFVLSLLVVFYLIDTTWCIIKMVTLRRP